MSESYRISSFDDLAKVFDILRDMPNDGSKIVTISDAGGPKKKRTLTQNGCLHEYIADLSNALNESGREVKTTITVPVDFTPETVKKYMVHPVMKALYPDIESTADLKTTEISFLYENLNRMTSEKFGIGLLWPSRDNKG